MSVATDSPSGRNNGTSTTGAASITWTHTVTAAGGSNTILVVEAVTNAFPVENITGVLWDSGGANTALTQKGHVSNAIHSIADIWYGLLPATGSKSIKVSTTSAVEISAGSSSYINVLQATPFNAASPQSATGNTGQPALTVTTATGEMVVDCVIDDEASLNDTLVQGGSQVLISSLSLGAGTHSSGASEIAASSGSQALSWTGVASGNNWIHLGVSLQAAAAGGMTTEYVGPIYAQGHSPMIGRRYV